MLPESKTLQQNGLTVTYYDSQETHGHERPIVLLHGTTGSTAAHFGFVFPILASRRRVVSIDFADTQGETLELADFTNQAVALIEGLGVGKVDLLGYSLGAVVAADVAGRYPDHINQLILTAGWQKTDLQQLLRNDVWQALRQQGMEDALRAYTTFCAFGGTFLSMRTYADMQAGMNAMRFTEFGDRQMELNRHIDISEQVEKIQAQTLVIGCTHDMMVPTRHQKALFGAIEKASYVEIPTGHAVVFERPSELVHHILRFLDKPQAYGAGSIIETPKP